ncbi:MAG: lysine--tRNA ligase [bacterium]|nr:lysine--tRNA ligase [Acidimicrobiia bacterium]MCY4650104.1 lysine--tRNA ligase [bacterium]
MNDQRSDRSDPSSAGLWERVVEERLDGLENLGALEIEPWPTRFDRTHTTSEIRDLYSGLEPDARTGKVVSVAGRVRLIRNFGRLVFITFSDQQAELQLFVSRSGLAPESQEVLSHLDLGDWVGATGEVITTRRGELSVDVNAIGLLAKCLAPLPDKWKGLRDVEQRSRHRHLDLVINPQSRRTFEVRSAVVSELRNQFHQRGFMEVDTPILTSRAAGAAARPFLTHHNALDIELYMRIATELYLKRLIIGGFERVFEVGRIFRNEGVDSSHNPEFTMLESYQAFCDYRDVMRLLEEVLPAVAVTATGSTTVGGEAVDDAAGRPMLETPLSLEPPYREVTMLELVSEVMGEEVTLDVPRDSLRVPAEGLGLDIREGWTTGRIIYEIFDRLAVPQLHSPTFVTEYPIEVSPLARRHPGDPRLTERFELFIAGVEFANAFSELNDPVDQLSRFEDQADLLGADDPELHPVDEDFVLALGYGMPPTGGLGLGVDRLVMLLTNRTHIRDVILFPTLRPTENPRWQTYRRLLLQRGASLSR